MFIEEQSYECNPLGQHNKPTQKIKKQKQKIKQFLLQLDEQNNSQDEGIQDYKIGGYHPVHIGQVLLSRYVVIQKLGWGHFSTVWLCKDFKYNTYVAIKIQKSSPQYMQAAFDEVQILQKVQIMSKSSLWDGKSRDDTHVVGLLNAFIHRTYYGNHFCMVFQILRCNLLQALKRYNYEGLPIKICQQITKQVLMGLDYLHRVCGVIHTDLKPQNVMLCLTKQEIKQIVETGQLSSHELFTERTKIFRQLMGISQGQKRQSSGKIIQMQQKLKDNKLSRNQKKNLKKRLKKELDKEGQNLQNESNQQSNQTAEKEQRKKINELFNVKKGKIQINRGHKLNLPLRVKIADLGNACWKHHHFSNQIQTRQYRSPEVILGQTYNETADIWSLACMTYEMLTGDLLFQPKKSEEWGKNHDHLAQMQQLLGPFDRNFIVRSPKMNHYFTKAGKMKKFPSLNHYSLPTVLQLKNRLTKAHSENLAQFLLPMLAPQQQNRSSALKALSHPWLRIKNFEQPIKMSQGQYQQMRRLFHQDESKFRSQIGGDGKIRHFDGSLEDNNGSEQQKRSKKQKRFQKEGKGAKYADIRYIDRSFTDLGYIGYSEGISFDKLDECQNWQFK